MCSLIIELCTRWFWFSQSGVWWRSAVLWGVRRRASRGVSRQSCQFPSACDAETLQHRARISSSILYVIARCERCDTSINRELWDALSHSPSPPLCNNIPANEETRARLVTEVNTDRTPAELWQQDTDGTLMYDRITCLLHYASAAVCQRVILQSHRSSSALCLQGVL